MPLDEPAGLPGERELKEELKYLYRRLSTVNKLIRALQEYDLYRPKGSQLQRKKSA
jgi:hypothetical protein